MDKSFKGTKEEYKEFRKKRNDANKKYYSKPEVKEKKKKYKQEYNIKNKEKIKEYGKRLRKRPEYKKRIKKWKEENKEKLREYGRRPEYKKRKSESNKKYRIKNKEKLKKKRMTLEHRKRRKKWYEENKEHLKGIRREYYKTEGGKLSVINCNHRRLCLKKSVKTNLNRERIKRIFGRDKVCVYCGKKKDLELDHIMPLSKGGTGMFENFVLACKSCNTSKNAREVTYWCKLQGIGVPKIVLELLRQQKIKALD